MRRDVTELELVGPGLWYPRAGVRIDDGDPQQMIYKASSIKVNQGLRPSYFRLSFPFWCRVRCMMENVVRRRRTNSKTKEDKDEVGRGRSEKLKTKSEK
jgi:hypothetical protein